MASLIVETILLALDKLEGMDGNEEGEDARIARSDADVPGRRACGSRGCAADQCCPLDGAGHPYGPAVRGERTGSDWKLPIGGTTTSWYLLTVTRSAGK